MPAEIRSESLTCSDRPLITFLLLAYNQEQFVREAVNGAFSQTYSPLEIVLSDDCSPDRTFEIMSEMAAAYQGPHRIVLNRNQRNLGIGAHINLAAQLAQGELIVAAAGDDVSLPERTATLHAGWLASGRQAFSLFSDAVVIDENGRHLHRLYGDRLPQPAASPEQAVSKGGIGIAGCTHIFSRKLFAVFGPMDDQVIAEDMALPFRSLLLGRIQYVNEVLVHYRTHSNNISIETAGRPSLMKRGRERMNHEAVFFTWLADSRRARSLGLLAEERVDYLKTGIISQLKFANLERQFYRMNFTAGLAFLVKELLWIPAVKGIIKAIERRLRSSRG